MRVKAKRDFVSKGKATLPSQGSRVMRIIRCKERTGSGHLRNVSPQGHLAQAVHVEVELILSKVGKMLTSYANKNLLGQSLGG